MFTAYSINLIGLLLNIAGVVMVFFFGLPQPSHNPGIGISLELGTVMADGRTVAQHEEATRTRKRLYVLMSHAALALMVLGFALQFTAAAFPNLVVG